MYAAPTVEASDDDGGEHTARRAHTIPVPGAPHHRDGAITARGTPVAQNQRVDAAPSDARPAGPWPAPVPHERRPSPLSREFATAAPQTDDAARHHDNEADDGPAPLPSISTSSPTTSRPPLERVPLPEATIVRLPGGAVVPVTPLIARSARVADPDPDDDDDPDDHGDDDPLTWDDHDAPGGVEPDDVAVAGDDASATRSDESRDADGDVDHGGAPGGGFASRWIGDARLPASVHVLRDRLVPGIRRPIDHLLVAPDGVWVVAVEAGRRVEIDRGEHRPLGEWRLLVGGRDHTDLATEIGTAAHAVRKLAARDDIAVHAAVCVPGSDRTLSRGPKRVHGVWVATPRQLVELVGRAGPLRPRDIAVVVDALGARLRLAG